MNQYKAEITKAMTLLGEDPRTIFIGQSVVYPGPIDIAETLDGVPKQKKLEFPVAEDLQLGVSVGLSLQGFLPVSIFPRFDFLIIATNALVNHLDKIEEMSAGRFRPKVIIRTCVGSKNPLNPGPQHCQDHTDALKALLTNVDIVKLETAEDIVPAYKRALESERSTIMIELAEKMRG